MVLNGTTDIDPVPLVPPKQASRDVYPPGTAMQIFGFRHVDEEDTTISDQLQRGSITLWPKANCFSYLAQFCGYGSRWDNDAMLCAFDEDTSTERGDSGGAALMNGYLSGLNSWAPPTASCAGSKILDVFVDIGSVRHWIEDAKPSRNAYFVALHICDEYDGQSNAGTSLYSKCVYNYVCNQSKGSLTATLHGSNGRRSEKMLLENPSLLSAMAGGALSVFVLADVVNIGWALSSITLEWPLADAVCVDMVVAARMDGAELAAGSAERFWIGSGDEHQLTLQKRCGYPGLEADEIATLSSIPGNVYALIVHVCEHTVSTIGGSDDRIFARLHGVLGTSQWFQLHNEAHSEPFEKDALYLFRVNAESDIGVNVNAVELANESNDALCIDRVAAGNVKFPFFWKASRERFLIDNPCTSNPMRGLECQSLKMLQLECYDF